jgi:Fe2+ or Zn2+ uptake regulation protein
MPTDPHSRGLTRQRKLVLEVIQESHEHLDADKIYRYAKQRDAEISLATVYRALTYLKDNGWIQEHSLGEDHAHFERNRVTPHYHFTCKYCGRVIEFEAPQILDVVHQVCQTRGLQVSEVHLLLSGVCDQCSQPKAPLQGIDSH